MRYELETYKEVFKALSPLLPELEGSIQNFGARTILLQNVHQMVKKKNDTAEELQDYYFENEKKNRTLHVIKDIL